MLEAGKLCRKFPEMNFASKDGKGKIFLSSFFFVLVATRKTSGKRYREMSDALTMTEILWQYLTDFENDKLI